MSEDTQDKQIEEMDSLSQDFSLVFTGSPEGERVLKNLRTHCDYDGTCWYPENQREQDSAIGSRAVYCYIRDRIMKAEDEKFQGKRTEENYCD